MNRIKELRTVQHLTQSELAKKIGVNQSAVGKYEREELEPNISILKKMSTIFECSIDYLLGVADDFGVINIPTKKNTETLPLDESELLKNYRALSYAGKARVAAYADLMREQEQTSTPGTRKKA